MESEKQRYIHPMTGAIREIVAIFEEMGFTVADGPELEDTWHNFDALNVPKDHPARDMQDTFYLKSGDVLRTHTSPVQIRWMQEHTPPIRIIAPGKCYRNEATDMTHEAQFYQFECLVVDENINLGHLKGALSVFFEKFFRGDVEVRFRPGFFPFVEPGVEVDMKLVGENVPAKLQNKWVEMGGAGMVHPNVLRNAGIDPEKYQGFAWGFGIERAAMLKWGIDDARIFHTGDLRFVSQFSNKGYI